VPVASKINENWRNILRKQYVGAQRRKKPVLFREISFKKIKNQNNVSEEKQKSSWNSHKTYTRVLSADIQFNDGDSGYRSDHV